MKSLAPFVPQLKDRAIFFGWIAAFVVAGALLWNLSFPLRAQRLMRSVNRALTAMDESRQAAAPLVRPALKSVPLGIWYSLAGSDSALFVFVIMNNGILVPCGAEVSREGTVTAVFPLGAHARRVFDRLPAGITGVYARRVEAAFAAARSQ